MREPQKPKVVGTIVYTERAPLIAYGHTGRPRAHSTCLGDRAFRYHHHHPLDPAVDRGRVPPPCGVASFFPTPSTASGRGSLSNLIRNEETEGIHCSSPRFPTGY